MPWGPFAQRVERLHPVVLVLLPEELSWCVGHVHDVHDVLL